MIVEQQFQQVVTLILRTLSYLDNVKGVATDVATGSGGSVDVYDDLREEVNRRSIQLAEVGITI